ncbi:MAG: RNA polymerase sigma factor [Eubacterium sp.]|nr:RNA polymerase sigma factor [Eubacterium sp.]
MVETPVNDDELYERYKNGDTSAYDELILKYKDSLTRYLNGILHNTSDAEDMMIEAFSWIMMKKPWIREGCFKAYLFQVARRYAIRLKTRSHRKDEFSLEEMEAEPASKESVENTAILGDQKKILWQCMDRLDPMEREALYLVYYDGMTYLQAAEVMKVTYKKVDHLLEKGKLKMREELKKEGVTDPFLLA